MLFIPQSKAAIMEERMWGNGLTLLDFMKEENIPQSIYYNLPIEEKELGDEIISGVKFYILRDDLSGKIQQVLIPINEESQIHLYIEDIKKADNHFIFEITPTSYFSKELEFFVSITTSPYEDIVKKSGDTYLAQEFTSLFSNSIDFKRGIQKGDIVAMIYERKYRLGSPYGSPRIQAASISENKQFNYVFAYKDNGYYDALGREINKYLLVVPLQYKRISSKFSSGRRHPILGVTRPHLGVDYAAPQGTPIKAAGHGRVSFAGTKGGYGKTVIIQHDNGYRTLYAHMKNINNGIRSGVSVKQGRIIGFVGSTGLSTGPHLHFGIYQNGRARNPLAHLKVPRPSLLKGKEKDEFLAIVQSYRGQITNIISQQPTTAPSKKIDFLVFLDESSL